MTAEFSIWLETKQSNVEEMLLRLDTALDPRAVAGFLTGSIDPYLRSRAAARFQGEGDDVVGEWAPLAPATEAIREQAGYGASHPINVRTGELEDYIVNSPNRIDITPGGADLVLPGTAPSGELAKKVRTAQQGNETGPITPARPVLGMNERDLAFIMFALMEYIETGVKR